MATRIVTHVKKDAKGQVVGLYWYVPEEDAVADINSKTNAYFTEDKNGQKAEIIATANGQLRTVANGIESDNLGELPELPDCC